MLHRTAVRFIQENSFFALVPIGLLGNIDPSVISTFLTAVTGIVVAIYAVRFYSAQIEKSKSEKRLADLEIKRLELDLQKALKTKKNQDDEP